MSSEQTLVDVPMAAHPPSSAAADPTHSISDGSLSDAFVPSTGSLAPSGREHSGLSWRYEMRRQCQEILPEALYLGPADSGRYLPPLHALGITAIVIVRTDVEAPFLKPRFPNQFQYAVFDVGDRFEQNLIRIVPELVSFIDGATRDRGKVLVHDDNGISRAPALVIMYLMEKFSVSYDVAAAHVQERRYCVHLNEGFVVQCKAYEAMIQARIQHAQQQQQQQQRQLNGASINGTGNGLRKRGMDDDEGDEGDAGLDRTRRAPAQQMRLG